MRATLKAGFDCGLLWCQCLHMKILRVFILLFFVTSFSFARAAELSFINDGLEVNAGSLGTFTLEYPKLLDGSQKDVHKIVEKNPAGKTATVKYEGGAVASLALVGDGKVTVKFANMPADVKSFRAEMFIPIAYNQGGKWKIADKEGDFPKSKPAVPHLYQGHATEFQLTNYEGKSLVVKTPDYAFQELTDNREWNWPIFHWQSHNPYDLDHTEFIYTITEAGALGGKMKPLVDKFGQSTREEWPDKVKSLDELKGDVAAEKTYFENLHPPQLDTFGGLPGSKEKFALQGTGFFHVEKKSERWLLVDPAGNAFFHLGVCGVNPSDDYTLVKGRESAYEWVPPNDGEFGSAFRKESGGTIVSFHLTNQIRKYGQPYDDNSYIARMILRMRQWGFNSNGAFSGGGEQARQTTHWPHVESLPLNQWEGIERVPGIHETFDPFDENTRALVEEKLAKSLPARADDPLLIGYFIVNEPIYEEIPHIVPSLKGTHACKRKLVQWLAVKYKTIAAFNSAWEADAKAFDDLNDIGLTVKSKAAIQDAEDFATVFLDEYMRLVTESFRRHDAHHMLIGSRLQPATISHEWISRVMGKYVDVMSFNYYTYALDKELLRRIYGWTNGRPMMLSEFFWSSPKDTGLDGGREVNSQQERGLAYRSYVEQSAALGFVVGIEWFTLVDQSVTGRWFSGFDGERANSGIISVTDRPWKPMLDEAMKTNYDIYKVWLGEKKPFVWER